MNEVPWSAFTGLWLARLPWALLATAILAISAWVRGSVSGSGVAGGVVVGLIFYLAGDWSLWSLLAVFFVSSSLVGIPAKRLRPQLEHRHQRGARRSWQQVAANTAPMVVASLALPWAQLSGNPVLVNTLLVAICAGFAAAASDTWAGEIGVLSRHSPRLLWGLRKAEAGQSGGVSWLGILGALAGALAMSVTGFLTGLGLMAFLVATSWGFLSSLLDSLLGATVQALYVNSEGQWTEKPHDPQGNPHTLVRGWRWINNDVVNLVSVAMAVTGAGVSAVVIGSPL